MRPHTPHTDQRYLFFTVKAMATEPGNCFASFTFTRSQRGAMANLFCPLSPSLLWVHAQQFACRRTKGEEAKCHLKWHEIHILPWNSSSEGQQRSLVPLVACKQITCQWTLTRVWCNRCVARYCLHSVNNGAVIQDDELCEKISKNPRLRKCKGVLHHESMLTRPEAWQRGQRDQLSISRRHDHIIK